MEYPCIIENFSHLTCKYYKLSKCIDDECSRHPDYIPQGYIDNEGEDCCSNCGEIFDDFEGCSNPCCGECENYDDGREDEDEDDLED
jgi:hypothetical protein